MCVESLTVSISPDCAALKKLGGVSPDFYLLSVKDLDDISYDATDGFITALTWLTSKVLIKVSAKMFKHSYSEPIQDEGEGNVALYQQTFNAVVYHSTQAERNAIEEIVSLDRAAVIYQGRDGKFYVGGIVKNSEDFIFSEWGLKVTAGDDTTGVQLNDQAAQTLTISGNMPNKALIFGEDSTTAENIATLDGYLTNA